MKKEQEQVTAKVRQKYDNSSRHYDLMEFPMELLWFNRWRGKLFKMVKGPRVLEVGVGTGKNLRYYSNEYAVIGVDISEGMISKAKVPAEEKGIALVQMDAQKLAFRDHSFDAVVATFVFCSVPDPVKGLQEIRRVLKPGGQVLLLEHVLPKNPVLAWIFNALDPLTSALSGVHINRITSKNIKKAGLKLIQEKNLLFSVFKFFLAKAV